MSPSPSENLNALFAALTTRRPFVASHSRRVAIYAARLATQFGLSVPTIEAIRVGALLHDVGKILVSPRILAKSHGLTKREWSELTSHPEVGVDLVDRAGLGDAVCEIVLYHHERHDGLGYPDRLAGGSIQWAVRIVSVANAFEALTHSCGHRPSLAPETARTAIAREAGMRFCPWVVNGLLSMPAALLHVDSADTEWSYVPDGHPPLSAANATQAWTASLSS